MNIQFKKINNTHHQLICTRVDGSVEEALLETKSFLIHDFVHLAYETALSRKDSFWGLVAGGAGFMELREPVNQNADPDEVELLQTEMIVGPLQGYVQGNVDEAAVHGAISMYFAACDARFPTDINIDVLKKIKMQFNAFIGEWKSLPFGETMRIEWK